MISKKEIHKLLNRKIDIAFVPADPRLEEYYDLAVKYFAEIIDVKTIIPMHFRHSLDLFNSWLKDGRIMGFLHNLCQ